MKKTKARNRLPKKALTVGIVVVAIAGAILIGGLRDDAPSSSNSQSAQSSESLDADSSGDADGRLIIGNPQAAVTMIEYADYKCPECSKFHQNAWKQIEKEYIDTGLVKVEFRPFPVFGPDGAKALAGSYCAQNQGKFAAYHDALFAYMWDNHYKNNDFQAAVDEVLTAEVIAGLLKNIGMQVEEYDQCLFAESTKQIFNATLLMAADDDIQGTPSFIIGGQKIVGPQPFAVFKTLLDIQLR